MLKFIGTVIYVICVIVVVQVIFGALVWGVSQLSAWYLRHEEQKQFDRAAGVISVRATNVRTRTHR